MGHRDLVVVIWNVIIQIWQGVSECVVVSGFVVNDAIFVTALSGSGIAEVAVATYSSQASNTSFASS